MANVHGPENPADLMTKFLDADTMYKHLKKFGLKVRKELSKRGKSESSELAYLEAEKSSDTAVLEPVGGTGATERELKSPL
eukprot:2339507-Amphidinium_carterae.1